MSALDNLDIESAIASHRMWFQRFEQAILGIDAGKLEDLSVADDTKCVLGCWLYGPGTVEYSTLPLFQHIVATHHDFHQDAQRIVEFLLVGDVEKAEIYMATHFKETSDRLIDLLNEMSQRFQ